MKNRLIYLAITATITGVLVISIPALNWLPAVARVAVACGLYLVSAILLTIHLRKLWGCGAEVPASENLPGSAEE